MRGLAALIVVAALALAGCGGDENGASAGGAAAPAGTGATTADGRAGAGVVEMTDRLTFEPEQIEVAVGEEVTWKNIGKIGHTITAEKSKVADPSLVSVPAGAQEWDSGFVTEGESFSRSFELPGTYRYICIPHEGAHMVGTVVVK